jgi:hypothetical protein
MVRQALGLALLVTLVVLAMSTCGGGGGQEQANEPRPLPEVDVALRPGEYRTEEFKPSFYFRVGKGWSNDPDPPEGPDELEITWRRGKVNLFFLNIKEVYKPTRTGTPNVVEAPKDMVGWFQHHPYLKTDKPEPVTVGGVKGKQFDVVVEDLPEAYSGQCSEAFNMPPTTCLDIARLSIGFLLAFEKGDKERIIVLEDVKGETVTIDLGAPEPKFDEFAPEAQKVVDSVKWRGS